MANVDARNNSLIHDLLLCENNNDNGQPFKEMCSRWIHAQLFNAIRMFPSAFSRTKA